MSKDFLPAGYKRPSSGGSYFSPKAGENKIRIVSAPVVGFEVWTKKDGEGKSSPERYKQDSDFVIKREWDLNKYDKEPKFFWAVAIWDYADEELKVWNFTQKTIQDQIQGLFLDEDWGTPLDYDIKITRTGEKLETKYGVTPSPKKELDEKAKAAVDSTEVNLEALFDKDADPFGGKKEPETTPGFVEPTDVPF